MDETFAKKVDVWFEPHEVSSILITIITTFITSIITTFITTLITIRVFLFCPLIAFEILASHSLGANIAAPVRLVVRLPLF